MSQGEESTRPATASDHNSRGGGGRGGRRGGRGGGGRGPARGGGVGGATVGGDSNHAPSYSHSNRGGGGRSGRSSSNSGSNNNRGGTGGGRGGRGRTSNHNTRGGGEGRGRSGGRGGRGRGRGRRGGGRSRGDDEEGSLVSRGSHHVHPVEDDASSHISRTSNKHQPHNKKTSTTSTHHGKHNNNTNQEEEETTSTNATRNHISDSSTGRGGSAKNTNGYKTNRERDKNTNSSNHRRRNQQENTPTTDESTADETNKSSSPATTSSSTTNHAHRPPRGGLSHRGGGGRGRGRSPSSWGGGGRSRAPSGRGGAGRSRGRSGRGGRGPRKYPPKSRHSQQQERNEDGEETAEDKLPAHTTEDPSSLQEYGGEELHDYDDDHAKHDEGEEHYDERLVVEEVEERPREEEETEDHLLSEAEEQSQEGQNTNEATSEGPSTGEVEQNGTLPFLNDTEKGTREDHLTNHVNASITPTESYINTEPLSTSEGDKRSQNHTEETDASAKSPALLSLPALPSSGTGPKHGKFLILSRGMITGTTDDHNTLNNNDSKVSAEVGAKEDVALRPKKKQPRNKKKTKKNRNEDEGEEAPDHAQEPSQINAEPLSTMGALGALPAQEVSITTETAVMMRANDPPSTTEKNQSLAKTPAAGEKNKKNSKSKKKKKGLSNDAEANRRAVQQFNRLVQQCVMQSDPDAMRDILHDPRNHNFALDGGVLETVMKAYVMAAMFEDALYCLRHCTLPGTLDSLQTEHILSCLPQNLRNSSAYTAADMINALCIASKFDSPTSRTYFLRIVRGISLEFLEEATSARDRICSSPCERLVRAGLCVVNAHLKRGKKPADLLVVPGDQLGVFVPDTMENRGIQAGDAVSILPYAGPYPMSAESLDRNMIEATVTNTNPMVLRLQDKANTSLYSMLTEPLEGNVYRIDKLANRMGFNRQLAAAVAIAAPIGDPPVRDPRRPSPELIRAITAMDENIDLVMRASHGKLPKGELTSTAALCAQAIPWKSEDESDDMDQDVIRSECRLALEKYGALESLNGSQMLAVEGATSNRLTLVQGPPGTGKTLAATRILQHWARLTAAAAAKGETPPPILATSDSNIAVDNLVEGCAGVGLRVIRLGRPEGTLSLFCVPVKRGKKNV